MRSPSSSAAEPTLPNAVWFKPIMIGLMLVGLVWVLVFYLSGSQFPIPGIGAWNLAIGFGIAFVGFLMTTRWR
ncbi:cell division protein CrgA [Microbacterium elymi]|uniref:Cell division protein CrgA n=1 Tax=Microbacterium elymi TaxID=2909587 RepID=A0ABY5NGR5_9MICO|nr:cell division protein CrgA [Microbacterium elymi]UUT34352.1 cell division protein CrgA [Microbacterium elymi]